jgi:hypothetical protein
MTPEELITIRMVAFGIGWLDDRDDWYVVGSGRVDTIDSSPELETWSHRDPGQTLNQLATHRAREVRSW